MAHNPLMDALFSQIKRDAENGEDALPTRPMIEVQLMELQQRFAIYQASLDPRTFPFQPGQLVTIRPGSNLRQTGEPHIVLETIPDAQPQLYPTNDHGSPTYGQRLSVRVMCLAGDNESYLAWWVEAQQLEPYTGPTPRSRS